MLIGAVLVSQTLIDDAAHSNMVLQSSLIAMTISACVFMLRRNNLAWPLRVLPMFVIVGFLGYWFSTHRLIGFYNGMLPLFQSRDIALPHEIRNRC
ncbi:MAG: hypothetical protein QM811_20035 [Pirellulales bacterium]